MASLASGDSSQLISAEVGSHRLSHERAEDGLGGRWYYSRKEIEENSPSRSDGIDLKKETYLRKSYCTYLQDLGMRLKVPQVTIATAIIFCHRFYLRQSHAKNDRWTVATACMFLAGKVEETPRPLKDVILVSYEIIHKKDPAAVQKIKQKEVYEQQKELILVGERVVLATLGFDLNVQHPYKPLIEAIKRFKVSHSTLAQVAWNFVNDGLRISLALQFKPHHIAAGAIFLAAKFLKERIPSDGEKVWWQEFDVTPRILEEVSNQMLELYERNKTLANQGSEAEGSVAGGAANRAASRTSAEEHPLNGKSSQGVATGKPGTVKSPTAHQLPDHLNNSGGPPRSSQSNDNGSSDHISHKKPRGPEPLNHQESLEEIEIVRTGPESNSFEDGKEQNIGQNISKEEEEAKDRSHSNVELKEAVSTQSPSEKIEKIDANKLKELIKRKKSRGDIIRKKDSMDDFDPIVKELEEGVELAAAESEKMKHEKKNLSQPSSRLDSESKHLKSPEDRHHVGSNGQQSRGLLLEHAEEGEVSTVDNSSWDYNSPKANDRKRKAGSPGDKTTDAKRWRDNVSGEVSEESKMSHVGYPDRDRKMHVQENHA